MDQTLAAAPGAAPQPATTRFNVLGAISFSHFLNDMMQSLIIAIYPLLKTEFRLSFVEVGRQTVISLRSPILREVDMESHGVALFRRLNELNCDSHFGKWAVYRTGLVSLEYDLLADGLQEDELMTVVTMLARLADRQDDLLQGEFGGLRSFE